MQQEDLLKRLKVITTVVTVAFVVLIVGLLIQFGMIAHYHTTIAELEKSNAEKAEKLEKLEELTEYYQSEQFLEDLRQKL